MLTHYAHTNFRNLFSVGKTLFYGKIEADCIDSGPILPKKKKAKSNECRLPIAHKRGLMIMYEVTPEMKTTFFSALSYFSQVHETRHNKPESKYYDRGQNKAGYIGNIISWACIIPTGAGERTSETFFQRMHAMSRETTGVGVPDSQLS